MLILLDRNKNDEISDSPTMTSSNRAWSIEKTLEQYGLHDEFDWFLHDYVKWQDLDKRIQQAIIDALKKEYGEIQQNITMDKIQKINKSIEENNDIAMNGDYYRVTAYFAIQAVLSWLTISNNQPTSTSLNDSAK